MTVPPLAFPPAGIGPAAARSGAGPAAPRAWRPRILMVLESSSGGTGRHVLDLAEGLARRGCEVHVLYSTGRTDRFFTDRVARLGGVRCVALPMKTSIHPADLLAVRAARRYLSEHGPFDVIHGHSSKGGAVARLAAVGRDVAAFYTLHGLVMMDPGLGRLKRLAYLAIELALSVRTARVIAVAPEEQREAVRLGLGRSRVMLVPNGVDPAALTPRDVARRAMGLADDAFVVGFVGRLVSQKAPEVLIRAMRQVAAAEPRVRLVMVGAGPLGESLHALAKEIGVADQVVWLGERHVSTVLSAFDVFAMPSCKEGLPYVVLEAMSAGLPVVATNTAGVESLVETGLNGVVVPCGDVAAFGDALTRLASDAGTVARYGAASLRRVSRFTIDRMVDQTLAAYLDVRDAAPAEARTTVLRTAETSPADEDLELASAVAGDGGLS